MPFHTCNRSDGSLHPVVGHHVEQHNTMNKYKTSHELARELLAGPDIIAVIAMPVFDMPGAMHALPVKTTQTKIEDKECVVISAGE